MTLKFAINLSKDLHAAKPKSNITKINIFVTLVKPFFFVYSIHHTVLVCDE